MEGKTELQRNAIIDARRKELEIFQRALDIQWLNNRMEDGRMGRCLALIQREADMEKDYQERTDHAAIVNARALKDIQLGLEIAQIKREEACKLLRRQYLREHDTELQELTKKLEAGYVCRDLKQQILHNEYKRLQNKAEEQRANSILMNALYDNKEAKELEERNKIERTTSYRRDLQQQLVNRERQRQCAYEDTLVEKKMLEEIMRTMADEDQRELEQKRVITERSYNEMITFAKAREAWKEKQKKMVVIEERQIEEQKKAASDRSSAIVAERERKMRAKEELNERICAKIMADKAAIQERENIIKLLQEQEYLEKNVNDDIAERDKLERAKRDTKEALTDQMENRKRLQREQKAREVEFRKETEAKVQLENKKEFDKEMKKHEKGVLYSQELKKQIRENAIKREIDGKLEAGRAKAVFEYYKEWDKEVAAERERIIEEHAPNLIGYLQAGVLATSDVPAVKRGIQARPDLQHVEIRPPSTTKPARLPKCNSQCRMIRNY